MATERSPSEILAELDRKSRPIRPLLLLGLIVIAASLAVSAVYLNHLLQMSRLQGAQAMQLAELNRSQRDDARRVSRATQETLRQVEQAIAAQDYPRAERLLGIARSEVQDVGRARPADSPQGRPPAVVPALPGADGARQTVWIQFAGAITREQVAALNRALRVSEWRVQGASGERIGSARGLNEVRYSADEDRAAAEALARAVSAAGVASRPLAARRVGVIKPGVLEVWMSN